MSWSRLDFPSVSDSKDSACNSGDPGLIPGLGRSPGESESESQSVMSDSFFEGSTTPWASCETVQDDAFNILLLLRSLKESQAPP